MEMYDVKCRAGVAIESRGMVAIADENFVHLFDGDTMEHLWKSEYMNAPICLCVNPKGNRLFCSTDVPELYIYDLDTMELVDEPLKLYTLGEKDNLFQVARLIYFNDDILLATGMADTGVYVIDMHTGDAEHLYDDFEDKYFSTVERTLLTPYLMDFTYYPERKLIQYIFMTKGIRKSREKQIERDIEIKGQILPYALNLKLIELEDKGFYMHPDRSLKVKGRKEGSRFGRDVMYSFCFETGEGNCFRCNEKGLKLKGQGIYSKYLNSIGKFVIQYKDGIVIVDIEENEARIEQVVRTGKYAENFCVYKNKIFVLDWEKLCVLDL